MYGELLKSREVRGVTEPLHAPFVLSLHHTTLWELTLIISNLQWPPIQPNMTPNELLIFFHFYFSNKKFITSSPYYLLHFPCRTCTAAYYVADFPLNWSRVNLIEFNKTTLPPP